MINKGTISLVDEATKSGHSIRHSRDLAIWYFTKRKKRLRMKSGSTVKLGGVDVGTIV